MLETAGWHDYALLDSGHGRKLERYGRYRIVRPEEQAIWTPRRPAAEWDAADATFVGIGDEEADGRWRYRKPLGETWPMAYDGIGFLGRFTSFRHVGVFPEQVAHWEWLRDRIVARETPGRRCSISSPIPASPRWSRRRPAPRWSISTPRRRRSAGPARTRPPPGMDERPDPLDLRGRGEIRRARAAPRQPL